MQLFFFDDIYETYHDSSGISRQQTLNSHRLPKDCLKKYLTFVTKLKKCLIKTKNAPFKIFLTHCSVPFLLAKFTFCHASRRLWASYMSLKCICSGSVLIKYLTKLFQIGMWKWKHPLFISLSGNCYNFSPLFNKIRLKICTSILIWLPKSQDGIGTFTASLRTNVWKSVNSVPCE